MLGLEIAAVLLAILASHLLTRRAVNKVHYLVNAAHEKLGRELATALEDVRRLRKDLHDERS